MKPMTGVRILIFGGLLISMGVSTSCGVFRRAKLPPPPPAPAPAEPAPPKREPEPVQTQLPPPPPISPAGGKPPEVATQTPPSPAPPPVEPVKRKPSPVGPPARGEAEAAQTPAEPPASAAPVPQLTQILTAEQKEEFSRSIDRSIARARQILGAFSGRSLTAEQSSSVNRIQTFIAQAEQIRREDLVTAKNLAERADLLAQDLGRSLR